MFIPSSLLQTLNLESFATIMPPLTKTGNSKKKIWEPGEGALADVKQLKTDMRSKCVIILEFTPKYSQNLKMFSRDYEICCHERPEKVLHSLGIPVILYFPIKLWSPGDKYFCQNTWKISAWKIFFYFFLHRIQIPALKFSVSSFFQCRF